jgi:hypothetical protein
MRKPARLALGLALAMVFATSASAEVKKAVGSIELTDPAGDIQPINTSDGKVPGFDVVKLSISSDGKQLRIAATLKDPPGSFASDVVRLYFDTDNDPKTGVADISFTKRGGFEYKAQLGACADYENGGSACSGGMSGKVKLHWGAINLERFTGTDEFKTDTVVDAMGFGKKKASSRLPIQANRVEATLDYADLGLRPGQTIRILARESCADLQTSFFPEVLLTLK